MILSFKNKAKDVKRALLNWFSKTSWFMGVTIINGEVPKVRVSVRYLTDVIRLQIPYSRKGVRIIIHDVGDSEE